MSNLKQVDDEKEFDEIVKEGKTVVDFYADWCGPCKMLGPIFESVSSEYEGTVKFVKVNVDKAGELAQRFQVMSIPTILFFKDGEQVERTMGAISEGELKEKIDSV